MSYDDAIDAASDRGEWQVGQPVRTAEEAKQAAKRIRDEAGQLAGGTRILEGVDALLAWLESRLGA